MSDKKEIDVASIISENKNLQELLKLCHKYTSDKSYIYKLCSDISFNDQSSDRKNSEIKWLVIMKKLTMTRTNDARFDINDEFYAKFRANELLVVKIINADDPKTTTKFIINQYKNYKLKYEVGKVVRPNKYDINIDNVCSSGIHYFKSLVRAYYYRFPPGDFTGTWIDWYDNGKLYKIWNCIGQNSIYF